MDIVTLIFSTAKVVGVSGSLLLSICLHESGGFKLNYAANDKGTPSHGVCQVKAATAAMFGFKGDPKKLNENHTSILYAARYLRFQQERYGDKDWLMIVAAYNAGVYRPSKKVRGCPRNLKYVKLVQERLPPELQYKLSCGKQCLFGV